MDKINLNLPDKYPDYVNILTYKHYDEVPTGDHFRLIVKPSIEDNYPISNINLGIFDFIEAQFCLPLCSSTKVDIYKDVDCTVIYDVVDLINLETSYTPYSD